MTHPNVERVEAVIGAGRVRVLAEAAPTAAAAAEQVGVEVGAIANSLVFLAGGEPLLVMTSGAHRVDTRWLGEQLGATITRADADAVRAATGQPIGGVAPVGHPAPLRTLVDVELQRFPEVWAAGGIPHAVFATTYDELVQLTGGTPTAVGPA